MPPAHEIPRADDAVLAFASIRLSADARRNARSSSANACGGPHHERADERRKPAELPALHPFDHERGCLDARERVALAVAADGDGAPNRREAVLPVCQPGRRRADVLEKEEAPLR